MKVGVIVSTKYPETVINAFEFATYALNNGDEVRVCLLGKGIEADFLSSIEGRARQPYKIMEQMQTFVGRGGQMLASAECFPAGELGPSKFALRLH